MNRYFYYIIIGFLSLISEKALAQDVQSHKFPYVGSANNIPCSFNPNTRELMVCGFETDGKGWFWFAGGEPLEVACFEGTKQVWRRAIPECVAKKGMMQLHGDSLYIVDDVHHALYVLQAGGRGDVRRTPISYPASAGKARITGGSFSGGWTDDGFYITYSRPVIEASGDPSFWHTHTWFYDYAGNTLPHDYTDKNSSHLPENLRLYVEDKTIDDQSQYYKGQFASCQVYVGRVGEKKTVSLYNNQGKVVHRSAVVPNGSKPLEVIAVILDQEAHLPTPNFDLLRNNRIFSLGYIPGGSKSSGHVVVYEYKLPTTGL